MPGDAQEAGPSNPRKICGCTKYCNGDKQKTIPLRTWYNHAKAWQDDNTTQSTKNFFALHALKRAAKSAPGDVTLRKRARANTLPGPSTPARMHQSNEAPDLQASTGVPDLFPEDVPTGSPDDAVSGETHSGEAAASPLPSLSTSGENSGSHEDTEEQFDEQPDPGSFKDNQHQDDLHPNTPPGTGNDREERQHAHGDLEDDTCHLEEIQITRDFIQLLKNATLDDPKHSGLS
ncbi:hypothetical protein NEOLEDRAFT_1184419 [Neolentinus lepideus HHB14362 ss-1]|uniref:Uncharacterized protein n=1 Tax=Neolentinus lepideus HHB14362 ss-1 TaxID=1314782 RepID=A0A165MG35_9AGAM|nr:hypothetical protein NEOLEDRAFT_1184419 [Neolentinus lepideus HHB14362 ss-1]